jgi:osmotically-inducible protein OsmY
MKRLAACLLGVALAGFTAACDGGANDNHSNANNTNTNTNANANANANAANANTAAATNRNYNSKITKEEYEKDKDRYGREAKQAGETVGSGLTDGWLWVKTKGALAAADDLRDSTINVDVDNSVVTLRGSVDNAGQKTKAETTAKGIDGVKSVKNQLTVGAASGAANANNANKGAANANAAHK